MRPRRFRSSRWSCASRQSRRTGRTPPHGAVVGSPPSPRFFGRRQHGRPQNYGCGFYPRAPGAQRAASGERVTEGPGHEPGLILLSGERPELAAFGDIAGFPSSHSGDTIRIPRRTEESGHVPECPTKPGSCCMGWLPGAQLALGLGQGQGALDVVHLRGHHLLVCLACLGLLAAFS